MVKLNVPELRKKDDAALKTQLSEVRRSASKNHFFFSSSFFSRTRTGQAVAADAALGQGHQRRAGQVGRDPPGAALARAFVFSLCVLTQSLLLQTRRNVARVLTVMRQRLREQMKEKYAKSKFKPLDLRPKTTRKARRVAKLNKRKTLSVRQKKQITAFPQRKFALKA